MRTLTSPSSLLDNSRILPCSLALLLTLGSAAPVLAQGGGYDPTPYEPEPSHQETDNSDGDMETVIEVVTVPEGMGDGVITISDMVALSQFTAWCYDLTVKSVDPTLSIGDDASVNAVYLWGYLWDSLDADTKALISIMDVVWPSAEQNWAQSSAAERRDITANVVALVRNIWGDAAGPTAAYLAGEVSFAEYQPVMDAMLAGAYATSGGGSDESYNSSGSAADDRQMELGIHDAVSTYLGNFITY